MSQNTFSMAGGVARNPLVRLAKPITSTIGANEHIAIVGPNGGGKTNLLQALSCVISTVVKPVNELQKNRQTFILQQNIEATPFLFDEVSRNEPIEFRMFFRIKTNEYCY